MGIALVGGACVLYWTQQSQPKLDQANLKETIHFKESTKAITNPLMGFAAASQSPELAEKTNLVYIDVTWKELEAKKGEYDFEGIEKASQWSKWKAAGKHFILRFVLDLPGKEDHEDIPSWLKEEMTDPGDPYNGSYGKGFSPNYSDPTLRTAYQKAVEAMGKRWGSDASVAYIELGGLGHWGEWHVNQAMGIRPLPREGVREEYVRPWIKAFPNSFLLMRRPFKTAEKNGFGIYNDVFGDSESTAEWLNWIQEGGDFNQTKEKAALVAMPQAWETRPIGGELTSGVSMPNLLSDQLEETQEQLKQAHVSFLGPKIPNLKSSEQAQAGEHLLKEMGYRLRVSTLKLYEKEKQSAVRLTLTNNGVAPFYFDWPLYVLVEDEVGKELARQQVKVDIRQILPTSEKEVEVALPQNLPDRYALKLILVNPETGKAAVHFAVEGQEDQLYQELYRK